MTNTKQVKTRSRSNNEYVLYSYGEPVAMSADGNARYFGTDILGSVRSMTDKYGTVQADYNYDAFGNTYLGNLENDIGFGYCGKSYDVGTGLYDYGFRDYSPVSARFTTVDPIRDGANWFSYVVNDPVNYYDPLGLRATDGGNKSPTFKSYMYGMNIGYSKPNIDIDITKLNSNTLMGGNNYNTNNINASIPEQYRSSALESINQQKSETVSSYDSIQYFIPNTSINRQGQELSSVKAIVLHWTGVPNQTPQETIDYWSSDSRIGSAHFVIGTNGVVLQAIPTNERARHAGKNDGVYNNKATQLFGEGMNPNAFSIGIEMEPINSKGEFSKETIEAAIRLTAELCNEFGLDPNNEVIRHFDVTGKDCPKYYVENTDEWNSFIKSVDEAMGE